MGDSSTGSSGAFVYRKSKPFSAAELRFRMRLAAYATKTLLARLQARTAGDPGANQYTGLNVRVADHTVFIEAILTNTSEYGGLGFEFARLEPVRGGKYNLSLRQADDWERAERGTIASAGAYFMNSVLSPRASDWEKAARQQTFEECVDLIRGFLD